PQWAILSGITPSGCTDVDSVFIQLRADVKWSVPNVFSPNGDGLNEVFRPAVSDEAAILGRLEIYDRWGGLLFAIRESQPVSTFRGWDGTMNGQPVSPGVYVYVLSFSVPGQDEIRLAGDVTLLRCRRAPSLPQQRSLLRFHLGPVPSGPATRQREQRAT